MTGRNNSLISLLGGAAAGAIAMYLLDPDQGRRRREQLTETAGGALNGAGGSLGRAWDSASEHAKSIAAALAANASTAGEHLSDAARDFSQSDAAHRAQAAASQAQDHLTSIGQDLIGRVRGLGQRLAGNAADVRQTVVDHANDAAGRARDRVSSARQSLGSWVAGEDEHESHLFAHTVGTAAVVALGAGAMYFLDPERGRARRAWAGGKVGKIVGETGRTFHQVGQRCAHLVNRTHGAAHDLHDGIARGGVVSAEQLLQRVRSEMGHVVSHADQIQVMADADGNVELTGRVLASELEALLACVRKIGGVMDLSNRLEALDGEEEVPLGNKKKKSAAPQV